MAELHAGLARVAITPDHLGFPLMGYGNRKSNSTGIHDPIWARALVLRNGDQAWAMCSLDLCYVDADMVAEIRRRVAAQTALEPAAVLICTTHTHSGPNANDAGNWDRPFADLVAEAIVTAWEGAQPAHIAHGAGFLYGYSINRRWFDRPVDPGVGVLRIDDIEGKLLGVAVNFGLHPVVLGYDNYLVSADYVGYATADVEEALDAICLFTNGGCGDINPLTDTVRRQFAAGEYFTTMAHDARFYGEGPHPVAIGNRGGGTFAEAETIGKALAQEIRYVSQGLQSRPVAATPWHVQAQANHLDDGVEYVETQALGIEDFVLVAQPGEVFAESALDVKAKLRVLRYTYPWVVSYANDWQLYLTPEVAFPEGGYEVGRAVERHHSPHLQHRLWQAIEAGVTAHTPTPAVPA